MNNFLKYMLATMAGIIALQIIGFFFFLIFVSIAAAGSDAPKLKDNTVLLAKFDKPVVDRFDDNPMSQFLSGNFTSEGAMGLDQILKDIEKAKSDEKISGIFLRLSVVPMGWASLEEVRDALVDFKESGKFIIAHSEIYSNKSYYLASIADSVYLTPTGNFGVAGLAAQVMFYKRAMEKFGVDMQVIRHGEFKSAVEPYLAEEMSPENREQMTALVSSLWKQVGSGISATREFSLEDFNRHIDDLSGFLDEDALEIGLIDGLKYYDEILDELREKTGLDEDDDIPSISLSQYAEVESTDKLEATRNKIAVVYASGRITSGNVGEGMIGSERISKAIRKARMDKNVKAIVLRVNSPGGGTIPSEVIYREVKLAAEEKPVVASFGNIAGSGGYYIACPADTIIASETTITGSIGVYSTIPNFKELMNEKIGITTDVVKTNEHADLGNLFEPLDPDEILLVEKFVEKTYTEFVNRVAEGRDMSFEEVDAIAGGRIWSGADALDIGLIDMLGGLEKSIEVAAEMAGLENYRISSRPELDDPFTALMKQLTGEVKAKIIQKELGESYLIYKKIEEIKDTEGMQSLMPYTIHIH